VDFAQSIDSLAERALGFASDLIRTGVADESVMHRNQVVGAPAERARGRDLAQYQTSIFNTHFKLIVRVDTEQLAELGRHNDPSKLINSTSDSSHRSIAFPHAEAVPARAPARQFLPSRLLLSFDSWSLRRQAAACRYESRALTSRSAR
jgi:hypothetical protein